MLRLKSMSENVKSSLKNEWSMLFNDFLDEVPKINISQSISFESFTDEEVKHKLKELSLQKKELYQFIEKINSEIEFKNQKLTIEKNNKKIKKEIEKLFVAGETASKKIIEIENILKNLRDAAESNVFKNHLSDN